jgi:hypothetical protein
MDMSSMLVCAEEISYRHHPHDDDPNPYRKLSLEEIEANKLALMGAKRRNQVLNRPPQLKHLPVRSGSLHQYVQGVDEDFESFEEGVTIRKGLNELAKGFGRSPLKTQPSAIKWGDLPKRSRSSLNLRSQDDEDQEDEYEEVEEQEYEWEKEEDDEDEDEEEILKSMYGSQAYNSKLGGIGVDLVRRRT